MTVCRFCGTRQDIDLRQLHFRDLGRDEALPCPDCRTPLSVIEFDLEPRIRIERCGACHGMFFNPGELEAVLEMSTNPTVWVDDQQLKQIAEQYGFRHKVVYVPCPCCGEIMSHINFGGRSGVILDRCGAHGVWLNAGELRRLLEWWRVGGKLLHQKNEVQRIVRHEQRTKQFQELPGPGPASTLPDLVPDVDRAVGFFGLLAGLVFSLGD